VFILIPAWYTTAWCIFVLLNQQGILHLLFSLYVYYFSELIYLTEWVQALHIMSLPSCVPNLLIYGSVAGIATQFQLF